jgi:asparagine synthase (glutamine-hydrolysing)
MPGIVGIIGRGSPEERIDKLAAMLNPTLHEPFYTSGSVQEDGLEIATGWTAHKGSFSDCLPVWNEGHDICLIFSGEDFAAGERVAELKSKGHVFNPGDASVLVHFYEELGPLFLEQINGWFSGVLVDLPKRKILLFNDRYGVNRVYYHEAKNGFYFASEAKALLKLLPELRQLDSRSLGEYFSCGAVMQNRSLFKGISTLPGGSMWTFVPGQPVRKEAWFKTESWEQRPELSGPEYYEKLKETWSKILPRYFNGHEQVALSLTGGVDSRMILACAPRAPGALPCYTFGGPNRDCADVTLSRRVAQICRQPHETIPLDGSFFAQFPALLEKTVYVTDGVLDPTGAADLFFNRLARKIAPARITGLNGGEILRRLVMFKPDRQRRWESFAPELSGSVQTAAETYSQEIRGHLLSFTAFKQSAWHLYPRLSLERSQIAIRTPYFDNDLVALAFQAPPEMRGIEPALRLIAEANPALRALGTDRARLLSATPGLTLARNQWQEFTVKAEYAYDSGMPQWLARIDHLFAPFRFERLFLGRHKPHHFRVWYRDQLSGYVRKVLLDTRARARPYVNGLALERLVLAHTAGWANHTTEIHQLLTLELLQRQMLDPN